jgi:DNA-binding XRE family transcriptional regulator
VTIIPPDLNQAALRQELARLRAERGMSYDDLAEHTGLARRTLIEIEQGRIVGTLTTWHKIAHGLGVPLGDLVAFLCEGHEPPSPPQVTSRKIHPRRTRKPN